MQRVDVKEKARERELRVLNKWKQEDTFKKSIENRQGKPNFVFYEGPPTANGAPHIGHVLGRVIKDFICRYQTMKGHRVVRKAGWDTHGLPVELGVEKQLGISGKQDIENYGIEAFITKCKDSVFEYERQWRELTEAIAYWTDMDHPYITLDNDYIQSVWHVLSTIHRKGLLYRGHRVSPYCPCCQTTLSSHEVAQGYEDVKDLSATVKFKLIDQEAYVLAWTTTPWTLPANVALAVHPTLEYAYVRANEELYIVAKGLVDSVFKGEFAVEQTVTGAQLIGLAYQPPFSYATVENGHQVIAGEFVTDSSGTGIVHIAPAHGDDDYKVARQNSVGFLNVVDSAGKYTAVVTDFAGRFVKDAQVDIDIVKSLSERGLLFSKERYEHSYPFCWRCKTPLIYYATDSWFIETTAVKDQLIANNKNVNWFPGHLREGRFGKFLEDLVDWNISRNRYWGTPLNVWVCSTCEGQYAPHSRADLASRATTTISENIELHKPYVDAVHLHCPHCEGGVMTRTSEVIDVWFDSGSMPFAQQYYPFGDQKQFEDQYPADIICEGIDQTRGWFFSLLAVSTLYNGQAPYKAVLSTGHILDEHGQKMSKSKGNVIDPWEIINEYGTDAFRWALLADSAPWNSKRFSRGIVGEAKSKVIDTIVNTHAFFTLYASIDGYDPHTAAPRVSESLLDRWIVSRLNTLIRQVEEGLAVNDFLNPAKAIEVFVDEMSNWYIRRSRDRFWGNGLTDDKLDAYATLQHVLVTLSQLIAPFAPLVADDVYVNLGGTESVHLADYPVVNEAAIDAQLERDMETARQIVELARNVRNETGVKTRQPLSTLIVALSGQFDVATYEELIKDEINVKEIVIAGGDSGFVDFSFKLNLKVAGKKYGKLVGQLQATLKALTTEQTAEAVRVGHVTVTTTDGELTLPMDELLVEKQAKEGYASASGYQITVALQTELTTELLQEGYVRELIRAVQDKRKQLNFQVDQKITLIIETDAPMQAAIESFESLLFASIVLEKVVFATQDSMDRLELGDNQLGFTITLA